MASDLDSMDAERRQALLETAAREFANAGYEHASLNRIIRACRMSKSSFYHFVGSKQALFDAVVQEAARALRQELDVPEPADLAGPEFWDRVARFAHQLLSIAERDAWYVDFGKLFYLPDVPPASSDALRQVLAGITSWLEQSLAAGRSCGAVRDDLPASLQAELTIAVLRSMDRWSLTHLDDFDPSAMRNLARAQVAVVKRLLSP